MIARKLNIPVPTPLSFYYNILVEEFIGKTIVSPKLKDQYPNIKQTGWKGIQHEIDDVQRA